MIRRLVYENTYRLPMLVVCLTTALYLDGNLTWLNWLVWHAIAIAVILTCDMWPESAKKTSK